MIRAIIFDLDGVLVDATDWHYDALNSALGLFGFGIAREDHTKFYNGLPTSEKLNIMTEKYGLPKGLHGIIKVMKRRFTDDKVLQLCQPSHEKQILLTHLKKRQYKLACCSNAQKYSVLQMLKMSQLEHFFDVIIGNDEGFKPKPSPDIYLATFEKLRIPPQDTLIIEDAPHGIEAAKESGAQVIAVRGFEDVNLSLFMNLNLV